MSENKSCCGSANAANNNSSCACGCAAGQCNCGDSCQCGPECACQSERESANKDAGCSCGCAEGQCSCGENCQCGPDCACQSESSNTESSCCAAEAEQPAAKAQSSCCGGASQETAKAGGLVQSFTPPAKAESSCCGSEAAKPVAKTESSCCGSASKPAVTVESSCCGSSSQAAAKTTATSSCCGSSAAAATADSCCAPSTGKRNIDWIMWICLPLVVLSYIGFLVIGHSADNSIPWLGNMMHTSYEMVNAMWWGILLAAFFVGILDRIPRDVVMSVLGKGGTNKGIFRATLAGLLLDLCNHGILMVGMKLYERGASIGQVMAFLIASPWNSFTLTLIMIGLIGLKWTLIFIVGSLIIAWISGWIFDRLVERGVLPKNPHAQNLSDQPVAAWSTLKSSWRQEDWSFKALAAMYWRGLKESKMVLRWVLFGVVLIALVRAFVPEEIFGLWFGASVFGLFMTLIVTTLIEVCSEGSSPIAADLFNRAGAPGNAFTFLMAGAATDYTEIMAVKDTTRSWKIALYLPLVTVPQVLLLGWLMNQTVL